MPWRAFRRGIFFAVQVRTSPNTNVPNQKGLISLSYYLNQQESGRYAVVTFANGWHKSFRYSIGKYIGKYRKETIVYCIFPVIILRALKKAYQLVRIKRIGSSETVFCAQRFLLKGIDKIFNDALQRARDLDRNNLLTLKPPSVSDHLVSWCSRCFRPWEWLKFFRL